jgi:TPP-dependent pyruvate/acetoin dehydrogenase alpha subunit
MPISRPIGAQISDSAFYAQMTLIRRTEQAFFDLYARGLMAGTVHTSIGQEACAAGAISALDKGRDVIFSSHRAHGHYLAYCDDVEGLVAELLGRSSGVVGGVGGTQHLHKHNLYTNGIQGGIVPNAVGAALAEKLEGNGAIVAVFLGDGTLGEGVVYESMNLAALWQLPVLFVLEDNGYAQSTPRRLEHAGVLADRPRAFGIKTIDLTIESGDRAGTGDLALAQAADGTPIKSEWRAEAETGTTAGVLEIYTAACEAVQFVREQCRPCFLALPTYRLAPHSKGDDMRSAQELSSAWARDPLERLGISLEPQVRAELDAAAERRVQAAVERALAQKVQSAAEFAEQARWQPA